MARRNRKRKPPEQRRQKLQAAGRRTLRLSLSLALGLALGGGSYWAYHFLHTSPALWLRQIQVRGCLHTPLESVYRATNLRQGMNVFEVDPTLCAKRLEKLPWVRRARVERQVPDTVVIEVEEWQPAALVEAGGLYISDPRGELFKRAAPGDGLDLTVITGIGAGQLQSDPQRAHLRLLQALALIEQLRRLPCLQDRQVAELHLDELMGAAVVIDPGALLVEMDRAATEQPQLVCQALEQAASSPSRHMLIAHTLRGWQLVLRHRLGAPVKNENQGNFF